MTAIDTQAHDHSHGDGDHGHGHSEYPFLAHHFETPAQQFDSSKLGMWVFLATEVLFFGALFLAAEAAFAAAARFTVFFFATGFFTAFAFVVVFFFIAFAIVLILRSARISRNKFRLNARCDHFDWKLVNCKRFFRFAPRSVARHQQFRPISPMWSRASTLQTPIKTSREVLTGARDGESVDVIRACARTRASRADTIELTSTASASSARLDESSCRTRAAMVRVRSSIVNDVDHNAMSSRSV